MNWFRSAKRLFLPFSESQWIFPAWFWGLLGILTLVQLWLVSAQTIIALPAFRHDDGLFIKLAQHIASGEWLGPYDNLTLAKEPFYPFWIASMSWLGIPLSYSQHLLYVFSCLVFIMALRPWLYRTPFFCLLFYATLLFHPISYPITGMQRVLRESLYLPLPLLVLSFAIGLLLRKDASIRKLLPWNIGLGLSFAAFWLTREEGVILLPSLFLLLATLWISIGFSSQGEKRKRFMACCIPILLALAIPSAVAGINKLYYGIFTTCERTQSDYVNACNALGRVKPAHFQKYLPVARETRERIYKVSPAFAELRPFLEGTLGKKWANFGPENDKDIGSFFEWALREAVAWAGYYSSGSSASKYYRQLASEVNSACGEGILECYKTGSNFSGLMWRKEYFLPFFSTVKDMTFSNIRLKKIHVQFYPRSEGSDTGILLFQKMTNDRIAPKRNNARLLAQQQRPDALKLNLLNSLLSFFRVYLFVLVLLGIASYAYHAILLVMKRKMSISFIIATALSMAALTQSFLLSYLEVLYCPAMSRILMYESSLYPLLTAFALTATAMFFEKDTDGH